LTTTARAEAVSLDPATGETIARYPFENADGLERVLAAAMVGYEMWRNHSLKERCAVFARMAMVLRRDQQPLAELLTKEMGKPIRESRAEVRKTADALDWYAVEGPGMLDVVPTSVGPSVTVRYLPLGAILSVQPWNYPIWQAIRAAVGILLPGNVFVLKPAPNVVGCSLALERLWFESGMPAGTFSVLNAEPDIVSLAIADARVSGVTVTGSVGAGSAIAAQAGRAIKRSALELGGSDAFIVLADADLDAAAEAAVASRFHNNGQVCIAAKRIILEQSIEDEFTRRFVARVAELRVGDPFDELTDLGPMARADILREVHGQTERTLAAGGRLLCGGKPINGPGNFFEPTVIAGVRPGMAAFDEEVFGPVAALITANDSNEAIALANQSPFGLSASIWTRNIDRALVIGQQLEVGGLFVNKVPVSDPRIPIGGVKQSGFGRELSAHGVHEFCNAQVVWTEDA
jgi:succinate-semialdehyde dehydrogenase